MPGNIGWQGILIILLVLLVIFGPKRLPEMGRSLGSGLRGFKESISGERGPEPSPDITAAVNESAATSPERVETRQAA
jgi:sec-independent protein translocase protein TatA